VRPPCLTAIGAADWDGTDGRYQAYDAGGDGAGPLSRGVDQHRHHDKASDGIPHTVLFGRDEALRIDEVAPVLARPRPMLTLASDVGDGNDLVGRGITCAHVLPFTYSQFNVGVVQTVSLDFSVTGRTVITRRPHSLSTSVLHEAVGPCLGLAYPTSRTFNRGVWADVSDRSIQAPILNVGGAEVEVNDNPR
jgi:hypothetical protein